MNKEQLFKLYLWYEYRAYKAINDNSKDMYDTAYAGGKADGISEVLYRSNMMGASELIIVRDMAHLEHK